MMRLPEGTQLGAEEARELKKHVREARQKRRYPYPWDGLERAVEQMPHSRSPFVGYGSLLNSSSAALTLDKQSLRSRQPVIAFGMRRIFNYQIPPNITRYGPPTEPLAQAALNVRLTGNVNDAVNAVLVEMLPSEVSALRQREQGYDLEPVVCLKWKALKDPSFLAYILQCPDDPRIGMRRTNDNLEPHREYYRVCRDGAREFGDQFLRFWLETTFLGDGVTSVARWEVEKFAGVRGKWTRKDGS